MFFSDFLVTFTWADVLPVKSPLPLYWTMNFLFMA